MLIKDKITKQEDALQTYSKHAIVKFVMNDILS